MSIAGVLCTIKASEMIDDYWKDCEFSIMKNDDNYVISGKICELNDTTNEEKPDDFVHDGTRFYVRKWKNRGRHISVLEPIRARSYFKCLRRYRCVTQRAMQIAMSVLCCIFEAIHHGIALGP